MLHSGRRVFRAVLSCLSLGGVWCVGTTRADAVWNDNLLDATMTWVETLPGDVTFTVNGTFRRDAYGGAGAPVQQPAGTGPSYCLTCAPGSLPVLGDVIIEKTGGTRLIFGDGTNTPVLPFEVTSVDVANNRFAGAALDPALFHFGLGPRVHGFHHRYTRTGPFQSYLSTCCRDTLVGHQNGVFAFRSATVNTTAAITPIVSTAFVVWRGKLSPGGDTQIFFRDLGTSLIRRLSTTSTSNSFPWIDDDDVIWSGVDAGGTRRIFWLPIADLGGIPTAIGPASLVDNAAPRIDGDWIAATGSSTVGGPRTVWTQRLHPSEAPRIVSSLSSANHIHLSVSLNSVLFSGLNLSGTDTRTYWQDVLDPGGPVEVSDGRGTACAAKGEVYCTLRVFECTDVATGQVRIFFRTVPLLADNPMIALSPTSTGSQQPHVRGVKAIFPDQARNLFLVRDVLAFQEDTDSPIQLNDGATTGIAPPPIDSGLEAEYDLSEDWVVWAGGASSQIFSRNLPMLPGGTINLVSGTVQNNSQVAIKGTWAVWKGTDPGTGRVEIYYKDVAAATSPARVSDNTVFESEYPRLVLVSTIPSTSGVPTLGPGGIVLLCSIMAVLSVLMVLRRERNETTA
jgi:hypothetical protein